MLIVLWIATIQCSIQSVVLKVFASRLLQSKVRPASECSKLNFWNKPMFSKNVKHFRLHGMCSSALGILNANGILGSKSDYFSGIFEFKLVQFHICWSIEINSRKIHITFARRTVFFLHESRIEVWSEVIMTPGQRVWHKFVPF